MEKKIVGIFVCMLIIVTALPATGIVNDKITWFLKENNYSEPYPSTPTNSPDVITIKIVAKVVDILDPYNFLGGTIHINNTISGKYTYDSETPDQEPDNPTWGEYWHNSSPYGIEVKAGEFVFKTDPNDVEFAIEIYDDRPDYQDSYVVFSGKNQPLSNGLKVDLIIWWLYDGSCTALSSDALPTTAPKLSDWVQSAYYYGLMLIASDPFNQYHYCGIQADVTKATKSRARDIHFNMPPILIWLFERFPNMFPILRYLIKL